MHVDVRMYTLLITSLPIIPIVTTPSFTLSFIKGLLVTVSVCVCVWGGGGGGCTGK